MKEKLFKDSVHGYISIPSYYCEELVNTEVLQRLRHIEQTSIRVLYPSAHHDRFSHSLGVYHLGNIAFRNIRTNSEKKTIEFISEKEWEKYERTFLSACLLHDCGHAPFSHTFEKYYEEVKIKNEFGKKESLIDNKLREKFKEDYQNCSPAPHEKVSAIILLESYSENIRRINGNPELAARMILGCKFRGTKSQKRRFENCLIDLLNGKTIDVDKLDYIKRDTWASGVNNVSIDSSRLLSALVIDIYDGIPTLTFNKRALSVLQNVLDGRNYLYRWLYIHHKVLYDQYLLREAVKKLSKIIKNPPRKFFDGFFSIDALKKPVRIGKENIYLPTDGDVLYLLKKHIKRIPEAKEWISRKHQRKALWKTYAEFDLFFHGKTEDDRSIIFQNSKKYLENYRKKKKWKRKFITISAQSKFVSFDRNEIKINILGKVIPYTKTLTKREIEDMGKKEEKGIPSFSFIYAPLECMENREECIEGLRNLC